MELDPKVVFERLFGDGGGNNPQDRTARAEATRDGSLLDHSMILYGSGMGNSNLHSHERIPIVVAGGASGQLKGGRHIIAKDDTPLSNLLMGVLDKARVPMDHVGDSSGLLQL
jgi:hypothetical protein